jgi:catechol 2,3-dioxygenase-like lactoylglutathione lyase family enzyme
MSRVQLALNVADIEASIVFYSQLLNAEPAKIRTGYANFAVAQPPLNLVLIEQSTATGTGAAGALNHLGVEVGDSQAVTQATRLNDGVMCCSTRHSFNPEPRASASIGCC